MLCGNSGSSQSELVLANFSGVELVENWVFVNGRVREKVTERAERY